MKAETVSEPPSPASESAGDASAEQVRTTRKPHVVSVRWGLESPTEEAATHNLSAEGMFLSTQSPPQPGTDVRVRLEIDACTVPLRGRVVWTRQAPEGKDPPGMGIHLLRPPALYVHYVGRIS